MTRKATRNKQKAAAGNIMRTIIFSSIFLLLLVASAARAQTPASTVVQCLPPSQDPMRGGGFVWEPEKTSYLPGERLTFRAPVPSLPCVTVEWFVNGSSVPLHDNPDICDSSGACLMIAMPESCALTVGVDVDYSLDNSCLDPEPTLTPTPIPKPPEPASIPEPITILLLGTGMAGLAGYVAARRR